MLQIGAPLHAMDTKIKGSWLFSHFPETGWIPTKGDQPLQMSQSPSCGTPIKSESSLDDLIAPAVSRQVSSNEDSDLMGVRLQAPQQLDSEHCGASQSV